MMTEKMSADVVVVGGGNAGLCAAVAAADGGARRVVVLETATAAEAGGNSWFTDGAIRFAFDDEAAVAELLRLPAAEFARVRIPPYPVAQYLADLQLAGGARANADLLRHLAARSYETMAWLRDNGVALELIYDNQAHEVDGRFCFFGNLNVRACGRGIGLVKALTARCAALGVKMIYGARARDLLTRSDGAVCGVAATRGGVDGGSADGGRLEISAKSVVLACGGFEANAEWRARELGAVWRQAVTRGTRHNVGDGLKMAAAAGAARAGEWRGCHAVGTDAATPDGGNTAHPGDIWKKHSYPYGILVNRRGERFVDEGADLRNYTYAKYGKEILRQPGAMAYQIFDAQSEPLLRSEYRHEFARRMQAESLESLAAMLDIDSENFLREVESFNAAVKKADAAQAVTFNPAIKDGKRTLGLAIEKSNWAQPLTQPPFLAFPVVCGITFTFGGVAVNTDAAVLDTAGNPIAGLFAAGEMVGGLFGNNYPGGSGLMSGAVFGRTAGTTAATPIK